MSTPCISQISQLSHLIEAQSELTRRVEEFLAINDASVANKLKSDHLSNIYNLRKRLQTLVIEAEERLYGLLGVEEITKWLRSYEKDNGEILDLESKIEGGSFEGSLRKQEEFYRQMYGPDFKFDLDDIAIGRSRLAAIGMGLESDYANFPLVVATPEVIDVADKEMTEAEFAYQKLFRPLKEEEMHLAPDDVNEYLQGENAFLEFLRNVVPVNIQDFDPYEMSFHMQKEMKRVITKNGQAGKVKPKQVKLVFTDTRQNIPNDQRTVDIYGDRLLKGYPFSEMVSDRVNALTPQEWITLAAQVFARNGEMLSFNDHDWLAAVYVSDSNPNFVQAVHADFKTTKPPLEYTDPRYNSGNIRWRAAL